MKKAKLFNTSNTLLSWSNICDNVIDMYDVIEDATNASELVNGVNKVNRFLTFSIDRETKEYVRLIAEDCFGNIRYIKAWK